MLPGISISIAEVVDEDNVFLMQNARISLNKFNLAVVFSLGFMFDQKRNCQSVILQHLESIAVSRYNEDSNEEIVIDADDQL